MVEATNDTKIFVTLPNSVRFCGWFKDNVRTMLGEFKKKKDNVRAVLMQGSSKTSSWLVACHY